MVSQFIASFFNRNITASEISSDFINLFIIDSLALIFKKSLSAQSHIGINVDHGATEFTKILQSKFLAFILENNSTATFEQSYSGHLVHQVYENGLIQAILEIFTIFHNFHLNCSQKISVV